MAQAKRSKRFEILENREVHKDGFIGEWMDVGLIAMDSPNDPTPSVKVANGKIVEMDGRKREDFDMMDQFIADYTVNVDTTEKAMAKDSRELARMLVDVNVPACEVRELCMGLTPAKIVDVISQMNIVEIMMAMQKMRVRQTPGNQCHITSATDNPVMLCADAAEGAARGFMEEETTVAVVRYAALNAIAILVGSQTGRPGVLTQAALEEAFELQLGMSGLTSYAETVSVYGTESVFIDGDDTPWSKSFLASAYASRGIKMRFTSGTGSEVQMGAAEGRSMLYLEAKCVMMSKGAGVQGLQNGSISCIGVPGSVPSGLRAVAGENLITMIYDLEVASGNDQTFSHSPFRRTARMLPQMFPGTDLIFSGYSGVPNCDNMFAGSNWDIEDVDDYLSIQRDFKVDGGLVPVSEEEIVALRNKAARALQAVFDELGFPPISDEEVEAATYGNTSSDLPPRNIPEDLKAAARVMDEKMNGVDIIKALSKRGFKDIAEALVGMMKQHVSGDYLQTSAWIDSDWNVWSAVNDPNTYQGPGTGYKMSDDRWETLKAIPWAIRPEDV
jgi:propanediol dehydratase large subunit